MSGNIDKMVTSTFASDDFVIHYEPDNPRQSMEPEADMEPEDARRFIQDLESGMYGRVKQMPDDVFDMSDAPQVAPSSEKAKQYYGSEKWQLLSGISAAILRWDESGEDIAEMKEKYGGKFVEGVEIGERLAVYQGTDFEFSAGENDSDEDSKFTFVE